MTTETSINRRVLLVDDEVESRVALADFLAHEGYEVLAAASGLEALDHLRWMWRPACVVLDMRMPVMTGWEVRKAMMDEESLRGVPIIGITGGRWRPDDAAGFAALLAKPIHYDELRLAVTRCVAPAADEESGLPHTA